ncbi:MAG: DUF2585 family protein [bacterium]|nr:DUF2585 family protein [bacterium]
MILPFCTLIVMVIVTLSLRRRGRPWYRNRYSQRLIDAWTATHFGHGLVLFGLAKMVFPWGCVDLLAIVVMAETLWESFENRNWVIRMFRKGGDVNYFGDSVGNSGIDVLACLLGALTMVILFYFTGEL